MCSYFTSDGLTYGRSWRRRSGNPVSCSGALLRFRSGPPKILIRHCFFYYFSFIHPFSPVTLLWISNPQLDGFIPGYISRNTIVKKRSKLILLFLFVLNNFSLFSRMLKLLSLHWSNLPGCCLPFVFLSLSYFLLVVFCCSLAFPLSWLSLCRGLSSIYVCVSLWIVLWSKSAIFTSSNYTLHIYVFSVFLFLIIFPLSRSKTDLQTSEQIKESCGWCTGYS